MKKFLVAFVLVVGASGAYSQQSGMAGHGMRAGVQAGAGGVGAMGGSPGAVGAATGGSASSGGNGGQWSWNRYMDKYDPNSIERFAPAPLWMNRQPSYASK